ncbi:PREDICTED: protein HAIKU1-like [Camelina sativa]|uniref:Protein HAIKU1-like n=1 Tax=Camelina sativa TaxID=90675 RepID=A0ABM0ZJN6_CAMSA|nr:PREDICTED: protein HAIKU1-like [Camelina sativa]
MDRPRPNDHLGVNKTGKSIRKSPLHQSSFASNVHNNATTAGRPQNQPQVYNISKNDFRSIVQQLTGSPARESLPRPPQNNNPPKPQNTRLHRIRPAPLTQINRPAVPLPTMVPPPSHPQFARPPPPQPPFPQGTQQPMMMGHGDQFWSNTAESPVSEYMRYLQSSLGNPGPSGNQMQPGHEQRPYVPGHEQQPYVPSHEQRPYSQGYEHQPYMPHQPQPQSQPQPQPHMMPGSQPRVNMQGPLQPNQYVPPPGLVPSPVPRNLPSPRFNAPVPVTPTLPSPRFNQMYGGFPSPRYNGFGPLHSPTSQFLLPSPTGYPNMFSPRSPYPLLSPGVQYPQPLTPNFSFSQIPQPGSLGTGAGPGPGPGLPPPSPGAMFPLSPSGFFPVSSPRWSDY